MSSINSHARRRCWSSSETCPCMPATQYSIQRNAGQIPSNLIYWRMLRVELVTAPFLAQNIGIASGVTNGVWLTCCLAFRFKPFNGKHQPRWILAQQTSLKLCCHKIENIVSLLTRSSLQRSSIPTNYKRAWKLFDQFYLHISDTISYTYVAHFPSYFGTFHCIRTFLIGSDMGLRWRNRRSTRISPLISWVRFPLWTLWYPCEKNHSTLCRKSWAFSGYSCFLPHGILTGLVGISP